MRKIRNIILWMEMAISAYAMAWLLFQAWQEESSIQAAIEQDESLAEEAIQVPVRVPEEAETENDGNMLRAVNWETARHEEDQLYPGRMVYGERGSGREADHGDRARGVPDVLCTLGFVLP